jgi:DNA-binding SARP family transcriptional activator
LASAVTVFGQPYGLAFASNEASQDERTSLDLSPGKTLCFEGNFELSFDISFIPGQREYFGYIVRIIDDQKRNIDVLSYNSNPPNKYSTIVIGDRSTRVPLDLKKVNIFEKWNKLSIMLNFDKQTITYSLSGTTYSQPLKIDRNSCYKILFGANNMADFGTTDVTPMKIRNVQIREGNAVTRRWQLNEGEGNVAREDIQRKDGAVQHALWIKKTHQKWKLLKEFKKEGPISIAFDSKNELLHFVCLDSLLTFSPSTKRMEGVKYKSGRLNLIRGNQSFFESIDGKLYNIYIDQEKVVSYDFSKQRWNGNFSTPTPLTDNWQFNKFYSPSDSSLYMVGGYGHFRYKNKIRRYNIPSGKWDSIKPKSTDFIPRYLAALGQVEGGAYIIGGHGTQSGQQIHNPKSLFDLLFFKTADKSVKKIRDINIDTEDFVFANSLVIDEKKRSYSGLIFSKHKFKSNLQLIRGSLDSNSITRLADAIPFNFHDVNSYADLFYSSQKKRYLAVTLFLNDKNQTEVAIYSLAGPPLPLAPNIYAAHIPSDTSIYGLILAILTALAFYFIYVNWHAIGNFFKAGHKKEPSLALDNGFSQNYQLDADALLRHKVSPQSDINHDAIFLFGDLQLFNHNGNDITKFFTPLIKELFLVILLYSIRWERGISSEKLNELLWFDKSVESARNNRSVNIAKLKTILDSMAYCEISKDTGYWKAKIDFTKIAVDYHTCLDIIKEKGTLNKQKIKQLTAIIQRGAFLSNLEYEWLDSFKSEISNQVIDLYQHFASSIAISDDPEFLVEISNYIFYFDSVNEEAMMLKCKALVYLGKHSLAKRAFENFRKEYKILYGEEFGKDFPAILE